MSSSGILLFLWLAAFQAPPPDLREAARLDGEGRCAESEPIYQRALSAPAPSAALLNNAGNHYLACGNTARAREYFQALLGRVPSHANAHQQLNRLALEHAGRGEFKIAQQIFQSLAAARPGDFEALWNLGRTAARAGDLTRAREALEAALRLKPEDPGALLELGLAHAAAGDSPRAVFLLAQAEIKAPDQPGITLALARAAEDAGYYGDAAIAYDRYLKRQPGDDAAQRDRARAIANTPGRGDEGVKALEAYLARRPGDAIGHFYLAQRKWETNPELSLDHLAAAVKLDPVLAPAHVARAWLLQRMGRAAEALPHLETALQSVPNDVRALDQYGLALAALDRTKDAEKALRKAAALAPNDWEVRLHLGRTLMEQGREAEAKQWLDQYQKLRPPRQRDPRREPGMIELATLSAPQRRAREIERFQSMARSRPDDDALRLHLGTLLLADGREAEAHKVFESLLAANADDQTLAQAGRALLDAGRFPWAVPFLEKAGPPLDLALAQFHAGGSEVALKTLDRIPATADSAVLKARILDAAGREAEARQLLASQSFTGAIGPRIAAQAAPLLVKYGRSKDAARLLAQAQGNRESALLEAAVLALDGRATEAAQRLKRIEERWPEWAAPYVVHSLVLRGDAAAQKMRTAEALGWKAAGCRSLRDWLQPSCREGAP